MHYGKRKTKKTFRTGRIPFTEMPVTPQAYTNDAGLRACYPINLDVVNVQTIYPYSGACIPLQTYIHFRLQAENHCVDERRGKKAEYRDIKIRRPCERGTGIPVYLGPPSRISSRPRRPISVAR